MAVAGTEMEEVRPLGWVANDQVAVTDVDQTHIEEEQGSGAGHGATLDHGAVRGCECSGLDRDVTLQTKLVNDQVGRSVKRPS
jgi:hypothetical protein